MSRDNGSTPLHDAVCMGRRDIAIYLLEKGADANLIQSYGMTPLHYALLYGDSELALLLINKTNQLNTQHSISGDTPLHFAVSKCFIEVVRQLIERGADVRVINKKGSALLHELAGAEQEYDDEEVLIEIANLIIDKGTVFDIKDNDGNTPRIIALARGYRKLAKMLSDGTSNQSSDIKPVQLYNKAVEFFSQGDFKAAEDYFNACYETGDYMMQAGYALGICQLKQGITIKPPASFQDQKIKDKVCKTFIITNICLHLISLGYEAALYENFSGMAEIKVKDDKYIISVTSSLGSGGFSTMAWKCEGNNTIPLNDPSVNPKPTETDLMIIKTLKNADSLPINPIPEAGIPSKLKT